MMLLGNALLPRFYPLCFLCIICSPLMTWQHHPQNWKDAHHKAHRANPCNQGVRQPIAACHTLTIQPAAPQESSTLPLGHSPPRLHSRTATWPAVLQLSPSAHKQRRNHPKSYSESLGATEVTDNYGWNLTGELEVRQHWDWDCCRQLEAGNAARG